MDTVIIKIHGLNKFQITNTSLFWPEFEKRDYSQLSLTEKQSTRIYLRRFILKPPHQDGYLPKAAIFEALTKNRDALQYILQAEFSVPKLLYKNSLQEASESDLDAVLLVLKKAFGGVGVLIERDVIASASVSAVHFCKNVLLPQDMRMQEVLTELQRVDISKVVDITKVEFKDGGRVLHIYSGTIERVIYDKVADAMRPKIKRKDKGQIDYERTIIRRFSLQNKEAFRYEYRIKKGQTVMREINAALARAPKTLVIFKDLFTPDLCKTIILKSWRILIQRPENQLALLGPKDDLILLQHMLAQSKKFGGTAHGMNRAFIAYGIAQAISNYGAKELKRTVFCVYSRNHIERLTRKIEASAELARGLPYSNTITHIDGSFERFELITWTLLEKGV